MLVHGRVPSATARLRLARLLAMSATPRLFTLDEFVMKQFDGSTYMGTRIAWDKADFETRVNEAHASGAAPLVDGYAPFCKHLFLPNFTPATMPYLRIMPENEPLLRSGYEARTEQELPVLCCRAHSARTLAAPTPFYAPYRAAQSEAHACECTHRVHRRCCADGSTRRACRRRRRRRGST